MFRVAIKPELIRWARERSGKDLRTLKRPFPNLPNWEAGTVQPTLKQLEKFATKTYTPIGYLFSSEPPIERIPIPDFRRAVEGRLERPSPNLLDTIYTCQRRQDWMREYLVQEGVDSLEFVRSVSLKSSPELTAARMRATLGIEVGWASKLPTWEDALRLLRTRIEEAGVLVFVNGIVGNDTHRKLDVNEFRGFAISDPIAPLIFVNGADAKGAQMFTLAHELAHIWIGQGGVSGFVDLIPPDTAIEKYCNRAAAEFLVAAKEMTECWADASKVDEPFQYLARRFKVSPLVVARRALDLELVSKKDFIAFYNDYQKDERRKKGKSKGGDFYATQGGRLGKRFALAVFRAAKAGRLLYRDAYQMTGLKGKTFDRYAQHLGIEM